MTKQEAIYGQALAAAAAGWTFTRHANVQSEVKGIDPFTVMAAAGSPTVRYPHGDAHPGQYRHIAHGIVAVVDPKAKRVITVYVNVDRTELRPDQLVA